MEELDRMGKPERGPGAGPGGSEIFLLSPDSGAKPGQRILDTHLGSGSHAIACHYFGAHLTACEIDADYYAAAMARIKRETAQTTLFT